MLRAERFTAVAIVLSVVFLFFIAAWAAHRAEVRRQRGITTIDEWQDAGGTHRFESTSPSGDGVLAALRAHERYMERIAAEPQKE